MSVRQRRQSRMIPHINVTPLIDVLLVLLIIFMVLSHSSPKKFEAQIPEKPKSEDLAISDFYPVVTVNRGGGYLLNREAIGTLEELRAQLSLMLDRRPADRRGVFVKAPRQVDYGEVVKVIDVMKAAGSAPIGLQTEGLDR